MRYQATHMLYPPSTQRGKPRVAGARRWPARRGRRRQLRPQRSKEAPGRAPTCPCGSYAAPRGPIDSRPPLRSGREIGDGGGRERPRHPPSLSPPLAQSPYRRRHAWASRLPSLRSAAAPTLTPRHPAWWLKVYARGGSSPLRKGAGGGFAADQGPSRCSNPCEGGGRPSRRRRGGGLCAGARLRVTPFPGAAFDRRSRLASAQACCARDVAKNRSAVFVHGTPPRRHAGAAPRALPAHPGVCVPLTVLPATSCDQLPESRRFRPDACPQPSSGTAVAPGIGSLSRIASGASSALQRLLRRHSCGAAGNPATQRPCSTAGRSAGCSRYAASGPWAKARRQASAHGLITFSSVHRRGWLAPALEAIRVRLACLHRVTRGTSSV